MNNNPCLLWFPNPRVVMSTDKIGGYAYGKNVKTKMLGNKWLEIINQSIKIFDKKLFVF